MFNFDSFKERLKSKGISINADCDGVVAGLIWGVEGIEKVDGLGDVLFYIVNGTRYGVKPKRGSKHDIEWYYKQLKMGMQGAKAYNTGLTQFLNTWIRKGELQVVFKGKATAVASNLMSEAGIDNLLLNELSLNAEKRKVSDTYTEWWIKSGNKKSCRITFDDASGKACVYGLSSSPLTHFVKTLEALRDILTRLFKFKVVAEFGAVCKTAILNYLWDKLIDFETEDENSNEIVFNIVDTDNKIVLDESNQIAKVYVDGKEHVVKTMRELNNLFKSYKIAASFSDDSEKVIDYFIKRVEALQVDGKKLFEVERSDIGLLIKLKVESFDTNDMNRLNEVVEDKLKIIFPITQKWMDADKGQTFGNLAKVGDIVLYTDEWSSQEFDNQIELDLTNSKVDSKDLSGELSALYDELFDDCKVLNTLGKTFRVTADTVSVEVKETLGEVDEENFEGIDSEHDRLLYQKVSPEQFMNLWKTSSAFNAQQIQKILYGFKLASRTLGSKYQDKGIVLSYFYKKKEGKGYIRVEYKDELFIIYVSRSEDTGDIKVVTRKMRKNIPVKNFNLLATSVSSLAFERAALPAGFKPVWENVSKSET